MFDKILVPLDGSLQSQAALEPARWLAGQNSSSLRLVRTLPAGDSAAACTRERIRCEKYLKRLAGELCEAGFRTEWQVLDMHEEVADNLLQAISQWEADLVVMTSRSRRGLTRILQTSVSGRLLREATCPILVVGKNCKNFRRFMGLAE